MVKLHTWRLSKKTRSEARFLNIKRQMMRKEQSQTLVKILDLKFGFPEVISSARCLTSSTQLRRKIVKSSKADLHPNLTTQNTNIMIHHYLRIKKVDSRAEVSST